MTNKYHSPGSCDTCIGEWVGAKGKHFLTFLPFLYFLCTRTFILTANSHKVHFSTHITHFCLASCANGVKKKFYLPRLNKFSFFFSSESEDEKQNETHSANKRVNKSRKVKHSTMAVTPAESQYKRKENSTGMISLAIGH